MGQIILYFGTEYTATYNVILRVEFNFMEMISQKEIKKPLINLNKGFCALLVVGSFFVLACNQPTGSNESSGNSTESAGKVEEKKAEQAVIGYGTVSEEKTVDLSVEKSAILKIHEDQRQAYMKKKPSLMVDHFADDLVMVKNGKVVNPSKAAMKNGLQTIFNGVDYKKWDDVESPLVKISDDGTMAYVIVEKEELRVAKKSQKKETANRALVYIYKKSHGVWKVDCIASTKVAAKKSI